MFDNIIPGSPEEKLKQYEAFNSATGMFGKNVDVEDFIASTRPEIENKVDRQNAITKDQLTLTNVDNTDDLLSGVNITNPIISSTTNYNPIPTKNNPFPYLTKPVINLSKYDTDKTAQNVIKEIDSTDYSPGDKQYLKLLGARESDFRKTAGKGSYKGLYQFNKDSLNAIGLNMQDYLDNTKVQYDAALKYRDANLNQLKNYQKYIGSTKDGIRVTKNGLGAMAHLLGAATVRDYFDGTKNTKLAQNGFVDGNGTHISEYLKLFS